MSDSTFRIEELFSLWHFCNEEEMARNLLSAGRTSPWKV